MENIFHFPFEISYPSFAGFISSGFVCFRGSCPGLRKKNNPRNHTNGHEAQAKNDKCEMADDKWKMIQSAHSMTLCGTSAKDRCLRAQRHQVPARESLDQFAAHTDVSGFEIELVWRRPFQAHDWIE